MCTLIFLWKVHASAPLVLAANRDEMLDRPTAPMAAWPPDADGSTPGIVAGRDLLAGGTWLGVGRRVVAALTNHRPAAGRSRAGARSRGELVERALRAGSLEEVRAFLLAAPAADYGPFHLIATDGDAMIWATNRTGAMELREVAPGVHALGNYGLDNPDDPVVANVAREWGSAAELAELNEDDLRARLANLLKRGGPGWPLVRLGPYGTRSAALLSWGGPAPKLFVAEGPPDSAPFTDMSTLLYPTPFKHAPTDPKLAPTRAEVGPS